MARGDLSQKEWEQLEPLLPTSAGRRGRPYQDHRRVLNGILWIDRTGAPWRDLPERYGPWQTCYDRFVRWRRGGVWKKVLRALQSRADAEGKLVWTHCSVDGTTVRAHQHAAGARHTPAKAERAPEKGGGGACLRSTRTEPGRLQHQAARRLRRAGPPAGSGGDRGTAA